MISGEVSGVNLSGEACQLWAYFPVHFRVNKLKGLGHLLVDFVRLVEEGWSSKPSCLSKTRCLD